jgi:hypothetical protein
VIIGSSSYTTVLSLSLPAGSYVVTSKTTLNPAAEYAQANFVASCQLFLNSAALTVDVTNGAGYQSLLVSNMTTLTLSSPDTLLFQCSQPEVYFDNLPAQNSQLVATLVGGIN